ncbi:MAG: penicillin-binding protein [Deltaproteobacteria bacterium]|nr:MAG: penicillin-binding protein [Deltaproteobacteria bacterium]
MKLFNKDAVKFRMYVVMAVFLAAFLIILLRAYQLQVVNSESLRKKAQRDYAKISVLLSERGTIFDRNGKALAISVDASSIYARPALIKDKRRTAYILAKLTKQSWIDVYKKLCKKSPFVWIKRKVPDEWAKKVLEKKIEGVGVLKDTRRYYPARELASHVIGFVGIDNHGLEGIERRYDQLLSGPETKLVEIKDALRRPIVIKELSKGCPKDIYLTIDREIQFKVQEVLKKAVKKSRARSAQCIVMNPYTGEILAMAVVPEFNPNMFSRYSASFWRNRTITDCYEPGSVIKPFLVAAAIEEGVVTPRTVFYCENGAYRIGTHIIHDTHKHKILSVSEIIMVSSNIGAIKIGEKLGYHKFCKYLKKFGFGQKTGIDLLGERTGWIREVADNRPVDQATLFFGQGISVTSLQLATAMCAIANGGLLLRPYVVKEIRDKKGHIIKKNFPMIRRRVISEKTSQQLKKIMKLVVSSHGTAPQAEIEGFEVAGKTGTAQKIDPITGRYSNKKYVATFVGFVPVSKPKVLILVMIDEPKKSYYAGIVAAPVFKEIARWTLVYLGITPKKKKAPFVIVKASKREQKGKKKEDLDKVVPDLSGMSMRDVVKIASRCRIKLIIKGHGFAFKQYPKAGTPLKKVKRLIVFFN